MARGASITVENAFARGLITEFTPLNFPEQAVTQTENCVYNEVGKISRRRGIDYERDYKGFVPPGALDTQSAYKEFEWFSVANSGNRKILVQQIGQYVYFFSLSTGGAASANRLPSQINMMNYATPSTTSNMVSENECSFTTGRGYLFITHPFCQPLYAAYDEETGGLEVYPIQIEVRDIEGIDDGLGIDDRPTTLQPFHKYNLLNQGWNSVFLEARVLEDWQDGRYVNNGGRSGDWPSNADIWWLYKRTALDGDNRGEGLEIFDPNMAGQYALGNTPAPKGHFIYDAFDINRPNKIDISGLPVENAGGARPTVVAFFAGRVWYAGTRAGGYSSRVYFSQLIERDDQFGKCYQINDPTSETTFDLIDTDGGTLDLPLIEQVTGLQVLRDALIIFGSNGIYTIRGADNGPFRATNYVAEFVTSIGVENAKSVAIVDNRIIWWGVDSIYLMQSDQIGISFEVQNVSQATIQSLIDNVPFENRNFIKAAYNKRQQIVRWVYSNSNTLTGYRYDSVLELRLLTNAFYTYTLPEAAVTVTGIVTLSGESLEEIDEYVIDTLGGVVTDVSNNDVFIKNNVFTPTQEVFKFGCIDNGSFFTYAQIYRDENQDWITPLGGVSYESSFTTGYRIRGDILRKFSATPVVFVVEGSTGALIVRGVWDYGEIESMPQDLYRSVRPVTTEYQTKRLKVRGRGRSLQFKFTSVDDEPFSLIGWATFDTGGVSP